MNEKIFKAMFATARPPAIGFGLADLSRQAQRLAGKLSISGVQPKLPVKLDRKENMLIPTAEGGEYILKPQTATFANIPENEQCCMDIAEALGIATPLHCLLPLQDGSLAYVVKRFDRQKGIKIHQEDFAQILEANDKYKGSVEQIGRRLKEISTAPGYDGQLLFERVLLNFIIGNGDAHLKNYSISYREDIRLSPAYDVVCSKLAIPEEEDSAITINGKRNHLKRDDFDALADYLDVPVRIRYEKCEKTFDLIKGIITSSHIDASKQARFVDIVRERSDRLRIAQ